MACNRCTLVINNILILHQFYRINAEEAIASNSQSDGINNFVSGDDVTYTEVNPVWEAIGKPLYDKFILFMTSIGNVYNVVPDSSLPNDNGGFINKEPLFSQILGNFL